MRKESLWRNNKWNEQAEERESRSSTNKKGCKYNEQKNGKEESRRAGNGIQKEGGGKHED
jgi:hypothetical protein